MTELSFAKVEQLLEGLMETEYKGKAKGDYLR